MPAPLLVTEAEAVRRSLNGPNHNSRRTDSPNGYFCIAKWEHRVYVRAGADVTGPMAGQGADNDRSHAVGNLNAIMSVLKFSNVKIIRTR